MPKADELTRLEFASTGTGTDDSAKLVYFFAGVGIDGVGGQRTRIGVLIQLLGEGRIVLGNHARQTPIGRLVIAQ